MPSTINILLATLRAAINRLKLLSNHEVLVSEQVANGSSMCIKGKIYVDIRIRELYSLPCHPINILLATLRAAINRLKLLSNHEVLVSEQVANGSSMCIKGKIYVDIRIRELYSLPCHPINILLATLRAAINRLKLLSNHEVLVSEQVANGSSMCIKGKIYVDIRIRELYSLPCHPIISCLYIQPGNFKDT